MLCRCQWPFLRSESAAASSSYRLGSDAIHHCRDDSTCSLRPLRQGMLHLKSTVVHGTVGTNLRLAPPLLLPLPSPSGPSRPRVFPYRRGPLMLSYISNIPKVSRDPAKGASEDRLPFPWPRTLWPFSSPGAIQHRICLQSTE